MAHPRIEEVDDASDPEEMDLDAFDFAKPQGSLQDLSADDEAMTEASQIDPAELQRILQPQPGQMPPQLLQQQQQQQLSQKDRERLHREQVEKTRVWQCIYPIYFDASRTREQGRRVSANEAVHNPLARDIVDALQHIGSSRQIPLQVAFEPTKTHPRDWANPGRVRVLVKQDGRALSAKLANKHYLYKLIADFLRAHPATEESPLKLRIQGLPVPEDGKAPKPAVPRGFKMGAILPLHSPALTGGGVSDDFLKDMMAQMGGQLPPGMMGAGGSGGGKQKVKVVRR